MSAYTSRPYKSRLLATGRVIFLWYRTYSFFIIFSKLFRWIIFFSVLAIGIYFICLYFSLTVCMLYPVHWIHQFVFGMQQLEPVNIRWWAIKVWLLVWNSDKIFWYPEMLTRQSRFGIQQMVNAYRHYRVRNLYTN